VNTIPILNSKFIQGIISNLKFFVISRPAVFCFVVEYILQPGNTKGGSITVPLTSCFTGLDQSILQTKTAIVSCHTTDSKAVKQEVNGTMILPPLVFPAST
jgi:hypothetical protein